MKQLYSKLLLIIGALLILTSSSCKKKENINTINDLIYSAGHLEEPPHYDPVQQGEPRESYITVNNVEYRKTETDYKYAQKFDFKTDAKFSIKNDKSDNDVFLGAIIQGKYWRNDGDLISIGDFDREPMEITLTGIDIDGSNSATAYPSNADMTDAINELINTNGFTSNANNYTFYKEASYQKEQLGLSLGIHPNWMDNFGLTFEYDQSTETNIVYIYFKQVYYTISAELPSQPADFFSDKVDIDALQTRITTDNPAGYISSIDYGRVFIVKMTSTRNTTEMKVAVSAVFDGLDINAGVGYEQILENSEFSAEVYGGSPIGVMNSLNDVITQINNELEITNLNMAVPISYHIHYLDGGSFNTGYETTYTETEYEVTDASTMVIKKITFTQLPPYRPDGSNWDPFNEPDVYWGISRYNGSGWDILTTETEYIHNVTQEMLDNREVTWNTNFEISDFTSTFAIDARDDDDPGDEFMGDVEFEVNNDIINDGTYPVTKTLYDATDNVRVELEISWK